MSDAVRKIREKLEEEIRAIEYELTNQLPKELKKAIALGDLTENAEYKFARERQDFLRARLGQLNKRLADLSMLNLDKLPRDQANYGSRVVLYDIQKDAEVQYKLVASEESDASNGLISTTSPIGRSLIGKRVGDQVTVQTPAGLKQFEIIRLQTIHDD